MSRDITGMTPIHEPFDEWSAVAAVGALDPDERRRFDAHLAAGCARCETRLRQFSAVAAALPRALPDVRVPPELRDRVLARVAELEEPLAPAPRPEARPAPRRTRPWLGGLVAAGLAGLAVWGVHDARSTVQRQRASIESLQRDLAERDTIASLVSHTDSSAIGLKGTGTATRADGWIVWSPARKQGFLVIHHLPPLGPRQQYQLWAIGGQRPQSLATFDVDAVGHAALLVGADVARPELFAVTVEATGGVAVPSGPVVMSGAAPAG
jgi:anti-sigma-K factor RskA